MRLLSYLLLFLCAHFCRAQELEFHITPSIQFGEDRVHLDTLYLSSNGEKLIFRKFKFYLSNPQFYVDGAATISQEYFYLLDLEQKDQAPLNFSFSTASKVDSLSFLLGIDSLTNDAGVKGGVLDPLNGMYWSWQSGYINVKMEGEYINSEGLREDFIFHLGGFLSKHISPRRFVCKSLDISFLELVLDLNFLWKYLEGKQRKHIMSPGQISEHLLQLIAENIHCESRKG